MSDDERLSLTTAISDEDEGEYKDSPYQARSGAAAAAFQCTGAVRKAGFLSVKKWLLRKRRQVELARKRGWKGYWVCLKGTTLLFFPCNSREGRAIESKPRHLIIVDAAIMQPIPEHPKRDFIFCLSTAFGDAYLFQAPCQDELDNWISAIHTACGSAFARHRGRNGTLHLLQNEIQRLEKQIEADARLRHMAEIQMSVVADIDGRKHLQEQMKSYDESLEQYHCEQFRMRCYVASIQGTELPNPKTLLSHVSKTTKTIMNRLGVFTVSSFHAYICARSPSMLTNVISGRSSFRRRRQSVGSIGSVSNSIRSLSRHSLTNTKGSSPGFSRSAELSGDKIVQMIIPPEDQVQSIFVKDNKAVEDLLWSIFSDKPSSSNDYFIRCKLTNGEYYIPSRHEMVNNLPHYEVLEVCAKILYQVELSRPSLDQLFGFSIEAELVENKSSRHNQDELCVYVSRLEDGSLAAQQGIEKGDEIMIINGAVVSDLDMMYIESVLQEESSLCMMLRSCRTEPPNIENNIRTTEEYIESFICPPPPSDEHISDEMIGKLIVPSPLVTQEKHCSSNFSCPASAPAGTSSITPPLNLMSLSTQTPGDQIAEKLIKNAEKVTSEYCRSPLNYSLQSSHYQHGSKIVTQQSPPQGVDEVDDLNSSKSSHLTDVEKLRKVIRELIETERTYVEVSLFFNFKFVHAPKSLLLSLSFKS